MKSGLAFGLGLIFGGAGVGLVAHIIFKQKYEQMVDEEIAACREAFVEEATKLRKELKAAKKADTEAKAAEAMKTYIPDPESTPRPEYAPPKQPAAPAKATAPDGWKRPYVIDAAMFDSLDNPHKCLGINYYPGDGVVTHAENDEPISMDELDRMVGREALTHFGEDGQESDRVCVRNDNWKVDYEICIQGKPWAEILKEKPWLKK